MFRLVKICAIFLFGLSSGLAQNAPTISGKHILGKVEAGFADIQDYTVSLDVKLDLERLKVPQMKARMYFKQPDKIHFESEGFALLPKEGVGFNPSRLQERFDVESVTEEKASQQYTLSVRPRNDKTKLRRVFLTVNASNWTVEQILTPQFDGRQMKAVFTYQHIMNRLLPAQLTVTLSSDSTSAEIPEQIPSSQRTSQFPRTGTIVIRYSDYQINTGLKDELFQQNRAEK